jgi:hypothetical protein
MLDLGNWLKDLSSFKWTPGFQNRDDQFTDEPGSVAQAHDITQTATLHQTILILLFLTATGPFIHHRHHGGP